ncbi:MAG: ATP-binding protein [Bacteroidota bacterium]
MAYISHEIRNTLSTLEILAGVLQSQRSENLSPNQQQIIRTIKETSGNLIHLLDNTLHKEAEHQSAPDLQPIQLSTLLSSINNLYSTFADTQSVSFHIEQTAADRVIDGQTSSHIRQILQNLIQNAIKFTSQGNVSLKVTDKEKDVIRFEVIDEGIGIASERLHSMFSPFQQADETTQQEHGGFGLGLYIVKQRVEELEGKIKASSQINKGTTFTVDLPLPLKPVAVSDSNRIDIHIHNNGTSSEYQSATHILLIDDNEAQNAALFEFLKERVGVCGIAENGAMAVQYLAEHQVDLIVMDLNLPDLSWQELIDNIQSLSPSPIVVYSGEQLPKQQALQLEQRVNSVIRKGAGSYKLILKHIEQLSRQSA